jgi:hypothetical protein
MEPSELVTELYELTRRLAAAVRQSRMLVADAVQLRHENERLRRQLQVALNGFVTPDSVDEVETISVIEFQRKP